MNTTHSPSVAHPQSPEMPQPLTIHESISPLAAELLMKVTEVLAEHPRRYNQCHPCADCGSPCCIIGHMEVCAGLHPAETCGAENLVGLTVAQYQAIFDYRIWPTAFKNCEGARGVPASTGIARIEHFLRDGQ